VARLSADDKQLLIDLAWDGQLPADPVEVTHFFSFPLNEEGARAANAELQNRGYQTWLLTESEGDDYWHIAAVKMQSLNARTVASARVRMEALAAQHGGRYDFWDVTHTTRSRSDWRIRSRLLELRAARG
jgi:Regulator of ribonuclease activity B